VLVISSDAINRQPLVVPIVVGTDSKNVLRGYPVNVRVSAVETGLPRDTVFLCFQIRALNPARFQSRGPAGRMPVSRMAEVENAVRLLFEL